MTSIHNSNRNRQDPKLLLIRLSYTSDETVERNCWNQPIFDTLLHCHDLKLCGPPWTYFKRALTHFSSSGCQFCPMIRKSSWVNKTRPRTDKEQVRHLIERWKQGGLGQLWSFTWGCSSFPDFSKFSPNIASFSRLVLILRNKWLTNVRSHKNLAHSSLVDLCWY